MNKDKIYWSGVLIVDTIITFLFLRSLTQGDLIAIIGLIFMAVLIRHAFRMLKNATRKEKETLNLT